MKIVSFTMVNNESEIIESFIRYNYNFIDLMVIIDNGCTDNTINIIYNLINEGYNIIVYDESLEPYNQFELDNKYLNKIIKDFSPDIIIPLDADEFLTGDENPRNILEQLSLNKIYYIYWQWFIITENDDKKEMFIPKRMKYCLNKPVWNYSDGSLVTKTILPVKYFKKMNLTLSMGHHTVFGNDKVEIEELKSLRLAHYRTISEQQIIYKTCCYTIRDISTMKNNFETAQRTNQMALIEKEVDMWKTAEKISYAGYERSIKYSPIDISFCKKHSIEIKYSALSNETLAKRLLNTGREMAIKIYNLERDKKEKRFLKPIIIWMNDVRGRECLIPKPSNKITLLTSLFNVRGLLTNIDEIKFLKANYRLIVTTDMVKFLPYEYIVILDDDFKNIKQFLCNKGIKSSKIITLNDYKTKLGIFKLLYCYLRFIPSILNRINYYIKRNGIKNTYLKIKSRINKK